MGVERVHLLRRAHFAISGDSRPSVSVACGSPTFARHSAKERLGARGKTSWPCGLWVTELQAWRATVLACASGRPLAGAVPPSLWHAAPVECVGLRPRQGAPRSRLRSPVLASGLHFPSPHLQLQLQPTPRVQQLVVWTASGPRPKPTVDHPLAETCRSCVATRGGIVVVARGEERENFWGERGPGANGTAALFVPNTQRQPINNSRVL